MAEGLVFTLARLGAPGLDNSPRTRFLPADLQHDGAAQQSANLALAAADPSGFASRVLGDPARGGGLGGGTAGLLTLPQTFGALYLGQTFTGLVTAANFSEQPMAQLGIKVCSGNCRGSLGSGATARVPAAAVAPRCITKRTAPARPPPGGAVHGARQGGGAVRLQRHAAGAPGGGAAPRLPSQA